GLLLGELAEAAEEILRVAAEREAHSAAFHARRLAKRDLVPGLDVLDERLDDPGRRRDRARERRLVLAERELEAPCRGAELVEVGRRGDTRRGSDRVLERERGRLGLLDPVRPLDEPELGEPAAQRVELAPARELARELAHDDDRGHLAHSLAPVGRAPLVVEGGPLARGVL